MLVCPPHSLFVILWMMDSGASNHIVGNLSLFSKLLSPKMPHHIANNDGSKVKATGIGQATPLSSLLSLNSVLFVN